MEPEGSSPYSLEPATCPCLEPDRSSDDGDDDDDDDNNNRPDAVVLERTNQKAHSVDAAILDNHNLHITSPISCRIVQTWKKSF